jgi:hypothetical protein
VAFLPQELTAYVGGATDSAQIIQFTSVLIDSGPWKGIAEAEVGAPPNFGNSTSITDTATREHPATVAVRLGPVTGDARVIVSVPALNLTDTAHFTVLPGGIASVTVAPRDTVIYLSGNAAMRPNALDTYGNVTPAAVIVRVDSGPAAMTGSQAVTVTPSAYGIAHLTVASGSFTDTTSVVIAPSGTLAAAGTNPVGGGAIYMFNIDGSDQRQISDSSAIWLRWAPSGQSLIFTDFVSNFVSPQRLIIIDTAGHATRFDTTAFDDDFDLLSPVYSPDGQTVYYTRYDGVTNPLVYSLAASGVGQPQLLAGQPATSNLWPAPSPDGKQVAWVHDPLDGDPISLRVTTLATGTALVTSISGVTPVWSPLGDQIAYIAGGPGSIWLIHPDGTAAAVLSVAQYASGFDWSPDGAWIVATNTTTTHLVLINASTGLTLPLPFATGFSYPTWRPVVAPAPTTRSGRTASIHSAAHSGPIAPAPPQRHPRR